MNSSSVSKAVLSSVASCAVVGFGCCSISASATQLDYGLGAQIYVQATANTQDTKTDYSADVKSGVPINYNFSSTATIRGVNGVAAFATGTTTAFYGYLDVAGSGYATPSSGNGAASRVISYIGGAPLASFFDQFQVMSNTLPVGTSTSIKLYFDYTGDATHVSEAYPANYGGYIYNSSAVISSRYRLRDFTHDYSTNSFDISHGVGTFSDAIVVPVQIGDILQLNGDLYASGEAASYDAFGPSSFAFNDPTTVNIGGLANGVTLVTGSGHDYAPQQAPSPVDVPEPASIALLGLGMLSLVVARGKFT